MLGGCDRVYHSFFAHGAERGAGRGLTFALSFLKMFTIREEALE
jgi:hypothetical protein